MFNTYRHNKKRNIGLLREFFSRYMAKAIVENRADDFNKAKNLWIKYFNPKTKIYEEFEVFQALSEGGIARREMGIELLRRTKAVCENQKQSELDAEKTNLLAEISRLPKSADFFEQSVPNYKEHATIQVLMNAWRGTGNVVGNIAEMVKLEEATLGFMESKAATMLESKQIAAKDIEQIFAENRNDIDVLVLKLFVEKFNEKYTGLLSEEQSGLLSKFLVSDKSGLVSECAEIRHEAIREINISLKNSKYEQLTRENLIAVREQIESMDKETSNIDEDRLAFHMALLPLIEELTSADENNKTSISNMPGRRTL